MTNRARHSIGANRGGTVRRDFQLAVQRISGKCFFGNDRRKASEEEQIMKALILFVGWCILFVLCWPVAILALVLLPIVWLISLPLRLVGITIGAVFTLIKTLLFLPARLLGWKKTA
jgi:hypothetical protein